MTGENQYLSLCQKLMDEGVWVNNERTGKRCLTLINADFEYDASDNSFPLVTTRKSFWKSAIAEMLGYLRGYSSSAEFRNIGCKTWDANANENSSWLNNPHRKGEDDMGRVYGVQGRNWQTPQGQSIDQLKSIYQDLKNGVDNRGEILSFYNVGEMHMGCLRPCMHTHHFSVLDGTLHLTSYQRSIDVPLGLVFNMVQVVFLLRIMAQITGLKVGKAYHKLVNCHIYEDQLELMKEQLERIPFEQPTLEISPDIKSLEDLETWVTTDNFEVVGYEHHPAIKFPFSV